MAAQVLRTYAPHLRPPPFLWRSTVPAREVTAAVTKEAVEELGLTVGGAVVVLVTSTEVMLGVQE